MIQTLLENGFHQDVERGFEIKHDRAIVKVKWDRLWHLCRLSDNDAGYTWRRITAKQAGGYLRQSRIPIHSVAV